MNLSLRENATPLVVGQGSTPPECRRGLAHPVKLTKGPIIGCFSVGATYRNKVAYLESNSPETLVAMISVTVMR
jgi:hypothetical protein